MHNAIYNSFGSVFQGAVWLILLLVRLLHLANAAAVIENDDNVLHIGGIFPIGGEGGWQGGQVSIAICLCYILYMQFQLLNFRSVFHSYTKG